VHCEYGLSQTYVAVSAAATELTNNKYRYELTNNKYRYDGHILACMEQKRDNKALQYN
jgi:hypothetical protein